MQPELLLFDIGNTSIKIGLADARRVLTSYALPAHANYSPDSFGLQLLTLLQHAGLEPGSLVACVASSVVPGFDPVLRDAVARYLDVPLLHAPQDLPIPLENCYERPAEVGADRLVGAYAARCHCPAAPSLLVVDFGTAVTFDCVRGQSYLGGLIFPGPATALAALSREAAKLPRVNLDICAQEPEPGRNTVTSIQHGLVFGFVSMVEGLSRRLTQQMPGPVTVLATGGFARSIARLSPVFDHVLPSLLLDGLRGLYYEERVKQPVEDAGRTRLQGQKEQI